MSKEIIGVIPPIITPIDENEKVDEAGLRKLINHCIDHGIHGIFICGSNGECMSLTQAQRDRAIQIALDECSGRVPVIAGTGSNETDYAVELTKRWVAPPPLSPRCSMPVMPLRGRQSATSRRSAKTPTPT